MRLRVLLLFIFFLLGKFPVSRTMSPWGWPRRGAEPEPAEERRHGAVGPGTDCDSIISVFRKNKVPHCLKLFSKQRAKR